MKRGYVSLRAVEPEDADMLFMFESEPEASYHSCLAAPYSKENLRTYALTYNADPVAAGQVRFIIEYKKRPAGIVDLYDIDVLNAHAFVGIFVDDTWRNRGVASAALDLIADYACSRLRLMQLGARIFDDNAASIALFRKMGFIHAGTLADWMLTTDGFKDMMLWQRTLSSQQG